MKINARRTAATLLIAAAVLLGGGTNAIATGARTLKLIPNVNLRNGEVIRISGSGFTPGTQIILEMCNVAGPCEIQGSAIVTPAGTLPTTRLKVLTGLGAGAGCGMSRATLKSCYLEALGEDVRVTMNFGLNKVNGIQQAAENS